MAKAILLVFALIVCASEAYQMTRCQLVRELRKNKFPEALMRKWVCLVENESNRRTHLVGQLHSNGSRGYGLFQIYDTYWCSKTSTPGMDCNVRCADLVTDDITKASICALKIYDRHGFSAWYEWRAKCQGALPDISSC